MPKKKIFRSDPGEVRRPGPWLPIVWELRMLIRFNTICFLKDFLNPERVSMPDIDIDFCVRGRDEVINHVTEFYGRESVCQIITFGTMASKAAIKDVGRALNMPYGEVEKIAKLIPPPVRGRNTASHRQ